MKKKILSVFLCICIISSVFCAASGSAFAANDYFTVKVESGDTVYSICRANGLDFEKSKNLTYAETEVKIMSALNEESEKQLDALAEELCK